MGKKKRGRRNRTKKMMDIPAAVPSEGATTVTQVHLRVPKLRQPTPMARPPDRGKISLPFPPGGNCFIACSMPKVLHAPAKRYKFCLFFTKCSTPTHSHTHTHWRCSRRTWYDVNDHAWTPQVSRKPSGPVENAIRNDNFN